MEIIHINYYIITRVIISEPKNEKDILLILTKTYSDVHEFLDNYKHAA